jgi:two-component system cell cycle sensor histidine kinase/response regulator CckA
MAETEDQRRLRERLSQVADPMALLVGLFASAPVGFQIYRADGHCLACNQAFRELFGAEPPPEYNVLEDEQLARTGVLEPMRRAFAGETVSTTVVWYDAREQPRRVGAGRRCAVSCSAFPLFDSAGRLGHVALVFKDVTNEILSREEAEAERDRVSETQRRIQALLDHAPVIIFLKDLEGRHLSVSREAERTFGLSPDQMHGKSAAELFGAGSAAVSAAHEGLARDQQQPVQEIEELMTASGPRQFLVTRFPILDARGAPEAMGGIAIDVSEHKRAEAELRRSEQRFAQVFAALPMPALLSRLSDRRFVDVNAAWERLTGFSRVELLGRTSLDLGLWSEPEGRDQLFRELDERGFIRDYAANLRQKSGAVREVLLSVDHVELFGERCMLLLAHDVTELRHLERELRQSQKLEAVGRLAGGLAHDFNNILTAIGGANSLLLEGLPAKDPLRRFAEQIKRSTARAATLTHQLLTFTRKKPEQPIVLDPNDAVHAVVDMLQRMIGADLALHTELTAHRRVKVDPGALEQVILNLAVNARDAMPGGGTLTLRTADVDGAPGIADGAWVLVEVADTGMGMDAPTRARMFEPFFTTKEQGKGSGLGLSMVYGIVTQSRGHITVDSEPGRGSTFRVYLPREADAPTAQPPPPSSESPPRGHETIVLAEDDEDVREFLTFFLQRLGYQVLAARDGVEAMAIAARSSAPIDLLLTDVIMPRMDGIELIRRMSEARPQLKVLLMSGYPGDSAKLASLDGRRVRLLNKPFERDELARRVRNSLDGRD